MTYNILAVDPATVSGWCIGLLPHQWGALDIKPSSQFKDKPAQLGLFNISMRRLVQTYDIDIIVAERPSGSYKNDIMNHAKLTGLLQTIADDYDILYAEYSTKEIKKYITGNGNAKKEELRDVFHELGIKVNSLDASDAIGLYMYAIEKFEI